jgi:beta-1,4-N-acetylglucosaminyltransferase
MLLSNYLIPLFQLLLCYYALIITVNLLRRFVFPTRGLASKKLMIVFGSGGHTTEMLLMLKTMKFDTYQSVTFIIGHSDTWSLQKVKDFYTKAHNGIDVISKYRVKIVRLFRSRQVKQSYISSIGTTLLALAHSVILIIIHTPDIVTLTPS